MIFESHAHYDHKKFDSDREELLNSLKEHNIGFVVNISSSLETVEQTIELTKQYPFIYGTVGVHPTETASLNKETFQWLKEKASLPKIAAIGEIGLDYYWDKPERKIQKEWFEKQILLARECNLPCVIHSREAAKDTLDIMKALHTDEIGGVIHCFSYSTEIAKIYLNMGFYLGIGGMVTHTSSKKLREVVKYAPLEQLLLETDCPFLSPSQNKGKRNSSLNLTFVAQEIASIKKLDYEEVIAVTEKNAKKMYRIEDIYD